MRSRPFTIHFLCMYYKTIRTYFHYIFTVNWLAVERSALRSLQLMAVIFDRKLLLYNNFISTIVLLSIGGIGAIARGD